MRDPNIDVLRQVIHSLNALDAKGIAQCTLAAENLDEAVLFGTCEGFILLAKDLLQLALEELADETIGDSFVDEGARCTNSIKGKFNEFGDVWPICAMVTSRTETYDELKKQFLST